MDYGGFQKYQLNIDYIGLDATLELIKTAQKKYPETNFLLGDIEVLPFLDNSFDIIFTRHTLEHLPDYKKAISELYRVAKHIVIIDFFKAPTAEPDDIKIHYFKIPGEKFHWISLYQNHYNKNRLLNYINLFKPQKIEIFENLTKDNKYFDTIYKIIKRK